MKNTLDFILKIRVEAEYHVEITRQMYDIVSNNRVRQLPKSHLDLIVSECLRTLKYDPSSRNKPMSVEKYLELRKR